MGGGLLSRASPALQTECARYENGHYSYRIHRSPLCEYMVNFIHKLRHLPEKHMMNSVLENFTILQVWGDRRACVQMWEGRCVCGGQACMCADVGRQMCVGGTGACAGVGRQVWGEGGWCVLV